MKLSRGSFKAYSNYYSTENKSFGVYYNYSKFIHDLYKRQLLLNRKILAHIAILNRNFIYMIYNEIIKNEDSKEYSK
ncbi:50S ribosomal protein L20 chloroplastic [Bienertia sinuspersici]